MKTTLKVLFAILKVITVIMAIVGVIYTAVLIIMAKPAVNHVYDVVEECDGIDPDDEVQDRNLTAEAFSRTMADPRIKNCKFINVVSHSVNRIASFIANL